MKKIYKIIKSSLFISFWLILSSYLQQKYWNSLNWEYIYINIRTIFDKEFWFILESYFFGIDLGFWIEELIKFLSYEIPKECFKYFPIFFYLKYVWIKN